MPTNNPAERRRFSRIPFHAKAHINTEKGELHLNCEVIDISLKGILIKKIRDLLNHITHSSSYSISKL